MAHHRKILLLRIFQKRWELRRKRLQNFGENRKRRIAWHRARMGMHRRHFLTAVQAKLKRNRKLWVKKRRSLFWGRVPLFPEDEWRENFRMNKETFYRLVDLLRPRIAKSDTNYRKAVPADKRLAITIYLFASGCNYRCVWTHNVKPPICPPRISPPPPIGKSQMVKSNDLSYLTGAYSWRIFGKCF